MLDQNEINQSTSAQPRKVSRSLPKKVREKFSRVGHGRAALVEVLDALPVLICRFDRKLKITYANAAYRKEQVRGTDETDKIVGRSLEDVIGEVAFALRRNLIEQALHGEAVEFEIEKNNSDVSVRSFLVRYLPLRRANGSIAGVVETTWPISVYKSMQAQIQNQMQAQRLRGQYLAEVSAALSSSLDMHEILKRLVRVTVPNISDYCSFRIYENGVLKLATIGHEDPEKVAIAWERENSYPNDPSPLIATIQRAFETGKSILIKHQSKEALEAGALDERHLELRRQINTSSYMCVPVFVRARAFGVITFVNSAGQHDFSSSDLELAEEVAQRVALAIDNAQLYAESQAINRIKDEFLATLSHELRTPLNVICGYSQLLVEDRSSLTEIEVQSSLEAIARNARAQSATVTGLLDLSSIIMGQSTFHPEPMAIGPLLKGVCDDLRPTTDAKGVRLEFDEGVRVQIIRADRNRLRQVFWNLLSNAAKFTESGGFIDVSVRDAGAFCVIQVHDTGKGIDPDFLPYVFDRFRQEDSSITKKYGGLGLGLSISRHLVELHGGSIRAESSGAGKGATFTISLPTGELN